jgi:hypothetical protein
MNSFVNFKISRHGTAFGVAIIVGVVVVVGSVITLLEPSPARAKPEFAVQTKLPCARCHTAPAGGKELTDFGKEFRDNGFKLKN